MHGLSRPVLRKNGALQLGRVQNERHESDEPGAERGLVEFDAADFLPAELGSGRGSAGGLRDVRGQRERQLRSDARAGEHVARRYPVPVRVEFPIERLRGEPHEDGLGNGDLPIELRPSERRLVENKQLVSRAG